MNAPPFPVLLEVQDVSSPSARIVFPPTKKISVSHSKMVISPPPQSLPTHTDFLSGRETIYLRLGLEPMCWDLNPFKSLLGTQPRGARTWTQSQTLLVWTLCKDQPAANPGLSQLKSQSWFQDLVKVLDDNAGRIQWETKWQVRSGFV